MGFVEASEEPRQYRRTAALVVEMLSPGNETFAKFDFHAGHGVQEAWVVDPLTTSLRIWRLHEEVLTDRDRTQRPARADCCLRCAAGEVATSDPVNGYDVQAGPGGSTGGNGLLGPGRGPLGQGGHTPHTAVQLHLTQLRKRHSQSPLDAGEAYRDVARLESLQLVLHGRIRVNLSLLKRWISYRAPSHRRLVLMDQEVDVKPC